MATMAVSGATAAATPTPVAAATETQKKNRIQVSNTKKPLFFYVNLAKRYIQQHNEVELSALGMAITTVVTIAEILKNNGLATEKKVLTSTVGMKDENKGRLVQKAKIEIVLGKSEKFDSLMTAATVVPEAAVATTAVVAATATVTAAPAAAEEKKEEESKEEQ
ncbi:uncharacterized protein At2g34160 isoform X1 [Cucurbita maxima]|uniref:Uncharacterized protein At2g34160 isoform X1 n=1 Tax=Cucurbita maxima TaxID=3661 RepID=A0A6J1KEC8_CUCMA|nr:uncharacterized protein At2g34160 isoform X1 [Cucurbita maxima]